MNKENSPAAIASAAPSSLSAEPGVIYDRIKDVLEHYCLSSVVDGFGDQFPLVDALSTPGGSIASGKDEIVLISDAIYNEVLMPLTPPAQAHAIQAPEAVHAAAHRLTEAYTRVTVSDHGFHDDIMTVCRAAITPSAAVSAGPVTPALINALPQPLRDYIHELEARADPAGTVRELVQLRDTNAALQKTHRRLIDAYDTPGNRNPQARYAGYKNEPLPSDATDDEHAAWEEGQRAQEPRATPAPAPAQPQQSSELFDIARKAWEAKDPAQWWSKDGLLAAVTAVRDAVSTGQIVHCLACSEIIAQPQQGTS